MERFISSHILAACRIPLSSNNSIKFKLWLSLSNTLFFSLFWCAWVIILFHDLDSNAELICIYKVTKSCGCKTNSCRTCGSLLMQVFNPKTWIHFSFRQKRHYLCNTSKQDISVQSLSSFAVEKCNIQHANGGLQILRAGFWAPCNSSEYCKIWQDWICWLIHCWGKLATVSDVFKLISFTVEQWTPSVQTSFRFGEVVFFFLKSTRKPGCEGVWFTFEPLSIVLLLSKLYTPVWKCHLFWM